MISLDAVIDSLNQIVNLDRRTIPHGSPRIQELIDAEHQKHAPSRHTIITPEADTSVCLAPRKLPV